MISVEGLELRAGARLLVHDLSFVVADSDRLGLVGRNGAGKSTLMKILAGLSQPAAGRVTMRGRIGYLAQDPDVANPRQLVRDRVIAARDLHTIARKMREAEQAMASNDSTARERAMRSYEKAEAAFVAADGYAAQARAATIAHGLGLTTAQLDAPVGTLSGGQRRKVELARVLFSEPDFLLLDEPTNHLDADAVMWLREFLARYSRSLIIISHDTELLSQVVNRVAHFEADEQQVVMYNMTWKNYQRTRADDEARAIKQRAVADRTAAVLETQGEKMRAKATKAKAAAGMLRRAEQLREAAPGVRRVEKVARLRLPQPAPCGKVPLEARGLARVYGATTIFDEVDLAIDRGSRVVIIGLNGAGKTTLLRLLAGVETPSAGEVIAGHGLRVGYYAQEHDTIDRSATLLENVIGRAHDLSEQEARDLLGSFMFSGDRVDQVAGTLSGGERTRLALARLVVSSANVLLLDEPTNNLDPLSRAGILDAVSRYEGAILLVTHDVGAVDALKPDRVLLLPDGDEDMWRDSYRELVELA